MREPEDLPGLLGPFLHRWTAERFVWGSTDCGLGFVASWVEARTGVDPAAELRGRYRTQRGAARFLTSEGGAEAVYGRLATAVGWTERPAGSLPQPGDVGLLVALTRRTPAGKLSLSRRSRTLIGAVFTGQRWAVFVSEPTHGVRRAEPAAVRPRAGLVFIHTAAARAWGP